MAENVNSPVPFSPGKALITGLVGSTQQDEKDIEDFTCPICLQLLVEPVVLPCEHEFCKMCFTQNVQEANLQCPMCRIRISSWARRNARNGTLVDRKRWDRIKKLFPKRCEKRIRGEEDFEDDHPRLKRVLSENGAIRSEYEEEMKKLRLAQEAEQRASEELIQRLMKESESDALEREQQRLRDEEIARQLQNKVTPAAPTTVDQDSTSPSSTVKQAQKTTKKQLPTLMKWFSPKSKDETPTQHNQRCESNSDGYSSAETLSQDNLAALSEVDPVYAELLKQKQLQEEEDFKLALRLQKELNAEAREEQRLERCKGTVDGYLLRKHVTSTRTTRKDDCHEK
ncbi:E3 ubiquitin-protein ligase rnf168 isoform X2 [Nematostella vectensis]|uniref:E3 ubiquitin-protein ligase rnf168 isoform X2 n=1 Tax=Nematostella vectensis TaxID=45351 RepID=UPI002076F5BB|nr:E3 ubiquitin-protein ligase rnf168 isoform X2 [Nematostella vectensis]